ncbi:MAG: methyltransferase domain-containing protein [bacterium]|nr:methyltransferase domain-containing protein [bacterium]
MEKSQTDQTRTAEPLVLPAPEDTGQDAVWTGDAFAVGSSRVRVLCYEVEASGWTDALTQLHEDVGGSDHFIDVASRNYALEEVARCLGPAPSTVLEIGCSSGFLLNALLERYPEHLVVGSDYTRGTLEALGQRLPHAPLVQFDLTRCPLPDGFADVTVLLNVLEHIEDDEAAVAHLFRITRPGGAVIIEVPAGSKLFDAYDRALMHFRRYDMRALVSLLERAGFVVERRSHLGFFLYPGFYVAKRRNQSRYSASSHADEQRVVEQGIAATQRSGVAMGWVMKAEGALRSRFSYPVGIRCLVTGRKPASA